jgi:hypothetical protein
MPPVHTRHRPSTPRARCALGLALWALVLGQWLALAHAIGHPQGLRGWRADLSARAGATVEAHRTGAEASTPRPTLLHFVTAHADGSPACQLFDDLAQPTPAALPVPAPLLVLSHDTPAPALRDGVRRLAPGAFHARAPPTLA